MKKIYFYWAVSVIILFACNQKANLPENLDIPKAEEPTFNRIDSLVYEGVLPCADCKGIKTELILTNKTNNSEQIHSFELKETYLGKVKDNTFTEKGNYNLERGFEKDNDATIYILNYDKPETEQTYYMQYSNNTNQIYLLDIHKKLIDSKLNYTLQKVK